jgi:hypothetical protein
MPVCWAHTCSVTTSEVDTLCRPVLSSRTLHVAVTAPSPWWQSPVWLRTPGNKTYLVWLVCCAVLPVVRHPGNNLWAQAAVADQVAAAPGRAQLGSVWHLWRAHSAGQQTAVCAHRGVCYGKALNLCNRLSLCSTCSSAPTPSREDLYYVLGTRDVFSKAAADAV